LDDVAVGCTRLLKIIVLSLNTLTSVNRVNANFATSHTSSSLNQSRPRNANIALGLC